MEFTCSCLLPLWLLGIFAVEIGQLLKADVLGQFAEWVNVTASAGKMA